MQGCGGIGEAQAAGGDEVMGSGWSPRGTGGPTHVCMGDAAEGTRTRGVAAGATASPIPPILWSSGLSRNGGPSSDNVGGTSRKFCGGNRCVQGIPGSPCAQAAFGRWAGAVLTHLLRAVWSRCAGVAPQGTGPSPRFLTNTWLSLVLRACFLCSVLLLLKEAVQTGAK